MVYDMIMSTFVMGNMTEYATFARTVQVIASGVSYTSELADPEKVQNLIKQIPELAIVQVCVYSHSFLLPPCPLPRRLTKYPMIKDADRLDAIGATGIGRSYMYSGAHDLPLHAARALIDNRLCLYKERMKTKTGREMAETKTKRLELFKEWWDEECGA